MPFLPSAGSPQTGLWESIQGRLILLLLLLLVPILLIQVYIYYDRFQSRRAAELQANLELARAYAKTFEAFVMDIVHSELVIGQTLTLPSVTDQDRAHILDEFQADNPVVRAVFWTNPDGVIVASIPQ